MEGGFPKLIQIGAATEIAPARGLQGSSRLWTVYFGKPTIRDFPVDRLAAQGFGTRPSRTPGTRRHWPQSAAESATSPAVALGKNQATQLLLDEGASPCASGRSPDSALVRCSPLYSRPTPARLMSCTVLPLSHIDLRLYDSRLTSVGQCRTSPVRARQCLTGVRHGNPRPQRMDPPATISTYLSLL